MTTASTSLNSLLVGIKRRYFYIGLCLFCKIFLVVGDEKVKNVDLFQQNQNQIRDKQNKDDILNDLSAASTGVIPVPNVSAVCENDTLKKCMSQIPPLPDLGIPSTPQGVENACTTFNSGMDCVFDWAKKCLRKDAMGKLNSSILGAHEMFTFLCRDSVFRQDFLQHSDCYKRISRHWDDCAKRFILVVKSLNNHEMSKDLCCVRIGFLRCLMDVTHRFCTDNAAKFIQLMGETMIRSTLRGHAPKHCSAVSLKDCTGILVQSSGTSLLVFTKNQLFHTSSSLTILTLGASRIWF